MKVVGIHDGAFKKLDLSEMTLDETFQFKVRLLSVARQASNICSFILAAIKSRSQGVAGV